MEIGNNILRKLAPFLIFSFFLLLALASVWPGLFGPFLFDDFNNLGNLAHVNGELTLRNIGNYLAAFPGSPGRPISTMSFLINDYDWPSDPFYFKYTNVLIHLCNGLLIYWMLNLLPRVGNKLPTSIYWPVAAAAIWVIHPFQLSAQMLVVQRMTLLSSTFILLGCITYLKLLPKVRSLTSAFIITGALGVFTILAFLSKENGLLLPVFILVLNSTLLRKDIDQLNRNPKFIIQMLAIIPSLFIFLALIFYGFQEKAYFLRDFNVYERLLTQSHVLVDYLKAIALPRISGSGIYFDDYPITRNIFTNPLTLVLISLIAFMNFTAWIKRKNWPTFSFAVFWFFGGHLIESTTIPLEIYFEHRNYLPLLGPVFLLSVLAFNSLSKRKVWLTFLTIWTAILFFISHMQAKAWGTKELLSIIWAEEHPHSVRANQQKAALFEEMGMYNMAFKTLYDGQKSQHDGGDLIISALALACGKPVEMNNRNLYQETLAKLKNAKFSHGLTSNLDDIGVMVNNDSCPSMVSEQRWLDMSQALLDNPKVAKYGKGNIHIIRANFFNGRNMHQQTILELKAVFLFNPSVDSARDVGYAYLLSGNETEALKWLKKSINIKQPLFEEIVSSNKNDIQNIIDAIEKNNY